LELQPAQAGETFFHQGEMNQRCILMKQYETLVQKKASIFRYRPSHFGIPTAFRPYLTLFRWRKIDLKLA
jgi:hypothetical protein